MMRFRNSQDKFYFLADIGRLDLLETIKEEEEVAPDLFEGFIKRRKPIVSGLVNFRKSQMSKQSWRSNRYTHMKGIHKFHGSIAGKRLHRGISRFLATRITRPHVDSLKATRESLDVLQCETLKSLSSLRTHLYIENDYYMPLEESAEFVALLEYAIPLLNSIEVKIYHDASADLNEDEYELLLRFCDTRELCRALSEALEPLSLETIHDTYKAIYARMMSENSSDQESYFLTRLMENLLPCLLDVYERERSSEEKNVL